MADPHHQMLKFLGSTLTWLGYIDQGRARLNQALKDARQHGHLYTLAFVLSYEGWFGDLPITSRALEFTKNSKHS